MGIKEFLTKSIPVGNTGYSIYVWYVIVLVLAVAYCVVHPSATFNLVIGLLFGTIIRIAWDSK